MILRQTLNFVTFFGAGIAVGALAYVALSAMKGDRRDEAGDESTGDDAGGAEEGLASSR